MRLSCQALLRTLISAVILAWTGVCADQVHLAIKQEPDPTGEYPESKLYTGVLINHSKAELTLKAVKMPGGYVGSGTFFNCSVEEWDERRKSWNEVRTTDIKGFVNPRIDSVLVGHSGERTVCRQMLPQEASRAGACVRFRLAESWETSSKLWFSAPFVIGAGPGMKRCP